MKYRAFYIILILAGLSMSCGKDYYYNRNTKLIVEQNWKVNTYVDYSQNNTVDIRQAIYNFEESGILTKVYENNDTVYSEWMLSGDGKYLTIGSNVFKVTDITKRVMSLRYGDVEMFFIEAE